MKTDGGGSDRRQGSCSENVLQGPGFMGINDGSLGFCRLTLYWSDII